MKIYTKLTTEQVLKLANKIGFEKAFIPKKLRDEGIIYKKD